MITETRKKIIDIVELYMDKTLSEGCLIKYGDRIGQFIEGVEEGHLFVFSGEDLYADEDDGAYLFGFRNKSIEYLEDVDIDEIIGHYDISAVIKYIVNNFNYIECSGNYIEISDVFQSNIGLVLNKPLYLYTDEEDKELLTLLLEIKG